MKKKLLVTMLTLMLGLTLFAGGTMAWFTYEASTGETVFTAGTLSFDFEGGHLETEGVFFDNVNPGDTHHVQWEIENTGSKTQQFRAVLEGVQWRPKKLSIDNVTFEVVDQDLWEKVEENGKTYFYYIGGEEGEEGVFNPDEIIELELEVHFKGPETGNAYQGAEFQFRLDLQAIQTTNGYGWDDYDETEEIEEVEEDDADEDAAADDDEAGDSI